MRFIGFKAITQGEDHKIKNLPCQDAVYFEQYNNGGIAIVADGHGSEKHFRSQYGSQIAVEIGHKVIIEFLKLLETEKKRLAEKNTVSQKSYIGDQLKQLERSIITRWRQEVIKHYKETPLTDEENSICLKLVLDMNDEKNQVRAYGTTFIAAVLMKRIWFVIQIGDGNSVLLDKEGNTFFAVSEDENLGFGKTTSLCDSNAKDNFRRAYGSDKVKGITVATDGVTDSFLPEAYLEFHKQLYKDLYKDPVKTKTGLEKGVVAWSLKGSRDDASIAGIFRYDSIIEVIEVIKEKVSSVNSKSRLKEGESNGS